MPIGAGLRGPRGLEASVYATGLRHVSAFAFDSQGRLWATASGAITHRGDGVYLIARPGTAPVKVAGNIRGPLGLTWLHGTLYVASIGRVTSFTGLHGGHFAHRRTVLVGPVANGENNNLVATPGGLLLMGVSASCDHCVPSSKWSAAVVSFRPDGTGLRRDATGIRAGYGLVLYPGTSDLFVSMNQRDDLGARTPGDWLAVVRRGQHWGFPRCYGQGGPACRGVPKPLAVLDKHAAAGGVAIVTGQLGPSVGTAALVAEWQKGTVKRVALVRTDGAFSGSVHPFLAGLENPLPVATAADGSVVVGDWGTGRIYRITRR